MIMLLFRQTATSPESTGSPDMTPRADAPLTPDVTRTHTLRQAALSRELHELNRALAVKQELAQKVGQSDEKMEVMKIQYEVRTHGGLGLGKNYLMCQTIIMHVFNAELCRFLFQ